MSRLDEIKAREQAAFGGPWEALDADENGMHAVAVDGTVLVEVGDFCDAEFIAHAREDVPWLVERVRELSGAICWDTTCLNCSSLLDSNYDQYVRAEIAEAEIERLTDLCDEFRKREESQDRIRERLTAEVERLERWKAEALEVMSGLRELGRALGLGLGVQITGPAALAEVARLTDERDALAAKVARLAEPGDPDARMHAYYYGFVRTGIGLVDNILSAVAKAGKSYHSTDMWSEELIEGGTCESRIQDAAEAAAEQIRAVLAGSEADTSDTQPTDQEDQA